MAVHGDDCVFQAPREHAEEVLKLSQTRYEVKSQMMGEDTDLLKEASILRWKLAWTARGITWEADPRHAIEVVKALQLEGACPVATPGIEEKDHLGRGGGEEACTNVPWHLPAGGASKRRTKRAEEEAEEEAERTKEDKKEA